MYEKELNEAEKKLESMINSIEDNYSIEKLQVILNYGYLLSDKRYIADSLLKKMDDIKNKICSLEEN